MRTVQWGQTWAVAAASCKAREAAEDLPEVRGKKDFPLSCVERHTVRREFCAVRGSSFTEISFHRHYLGDHAEGFLQRMHLNLGEEFTFIIQVFTITNSKEYFEQE